MISFKQFLFLFRTFLSSDYKSKFLLNLLSDFLTFGLSDFPTFQPLNYFFNPSIKYLTILVSSVSALVLLRERCQDSMPLIADRIVSTAT